MKSSYSFMAILATLILTTVHVSALDYNLSVSQAELQAQCQANKTALKTLIQDNLTTTKDNREAFDTNHPDIKTLFKTQLTAQQKRAKKELAVQAKLNIAAATNTFASNYFSTLDSSLIASTVTTLKGYRSTYFTQLAQYIDPTKIATYNTYTADFLTQMQINKTLRLTTYAEILKYIKHCGGARILDRKIHGLFNGIFKKDHMKDELHTK